MSVYITSPETLCVYEQNFMKKHNGLDLTNHSGRNSLSYSRLYLRAQTCKSENIL